MLFDDILSELGDFGPFQICLYILLGCIGVFTGLNNLAVAFVAADMDHWCHIPRLQNFSHQQQKTIAIPYEASSYSQCRMYDVNFDLYTDEELLTWNGSFVDGNITTIPCSDGWVFDQSVFVSTAVSQMELVCDRSSLVSLIQTIYMSGFLLGCVALGQLSDSLGRRKTLLLSIILQLLSSVAAAFTPYYAPFVILRFIVGAATAGAFTTAFVVAMEIIGAKYRMATGILVQGFFAFGFVILPGISFLIRDHFKLQLVLSFPPAILLLLIFLLPESPRWLIAEGRDEEALKVIYKMAEVNERHLPCNLTLEDNRKEADPTEMKPTLLDLLKTPNLRKTTLNTWFGWFVCSMAYYGLSLGASLLGGSLFLNTFMASIVEIPALFLTIAILDRAGRRWPTIIFCTLSGLCCIACAAFIEFPSLKAALITFLMAGKFFLAGVFAILYVYAAELFPTVVRQIGIGSASMWARVGGLVQPQVQTLSTVFTPAPFIIYGVFGTVAGALSYFLPETLNQKLPETILEGENFGRAKRCRQASLTEEFDKEFNMEPCPNP